MTDIALDEKALEAATSAALAKFNTDLSPYPTFEAHMSAIVGESIRAYLRASPSQVAPQPQAGEPVAWLIRSNSGGNTWAQLTPDIAEADRDYVEITPLYASPQPANPAQVGGSNLAERAKAVRGDLEAHNFDDVIALLDDYAAAIGAGGQAVASLDDIAARLWKADAEDSGTPASVADGRTRKAFDDQSDELKTRWRKFGKAAFDALSQPHPADERVVEALRMAHSFIAREYRDEKSIALEGEFVSKEARPVFRALSDALAAKEGR